MSTDDVLNLAAMRQMDRQQTQALSKHALGGNATDGASEAVSEAVQRQQHREAAIAARTEALEDPEGAELAIDQDGNFKIVPKRTRAIVAPVATQQQSRAVGAATAAKSLLASASSATANGAGRLAGRWRSAADDDPNAPEHPIRLLAFKIQSWGGFRMLLVLCILGSAYALATEYPADASKEQNYLYVEMALNALFTLEFELKLVAFGCKGYFKKGWNLLDFLVVLDGWVIVAITVRQPRSELWPLGISPRAAPC